mmetsp:Transcript_41750/g.63776  ORF Transcript_41750/g.63776 Transcript_41750/m.63776 type:complete len:86 (-) Transcript_41750:1183-1440(-)
MEATRENKGSFSLRDIASLNSKDLASFIFTNSKQISEAKQMDKIQKLIEDQDTKICFYQIKLIKAGHQKEAQEFMVQVQDVSLRI